MLRCCQTAMWRTRFSLPFGDSKTAWIQVSIRASLNVSRSVTVSVVRASGRWRHLTWQPVPASGSRPATTEKLSSRSRCSAQWSAATDVDLCARNGAASSAWCSNARRRSPAFSSCSDFLPDRRRRLIRFQSSRCMPRRASIDSRTRPDSPIASSIRTEDTVAIDAKEAVAKNDVIDLTGKLRADDTLDWVPPPGRWVVLRFGYSLDRAQQSSGFARRHRSRSRQAESKARQVICRRLSWRVPACSWP